MADWPVAQVTSPAGGVFSLNREETRESHPHWRAARVLWSPLLEKIHGVRSSVGNQRCESRLRDGDMIAQGEADPDSAAVGGRIGEAEPWVAIF